MSVNDTLGVTANIATAGLYGTYISGKQQQAVAEYNEAIAKQDAQQAASSAVEEERRFRIQNQKELGYQVAQTGASGVEYSSSSALEVIQQNAADMELDALTLRHQGMLAAAGFGRTARLERARATTAQSKAWLDTSNKAIERGQQAATMGAGGGG